MGIKTEAELIECLLEKGPGQPYGLLIAFHINSGLRIKIYRA
jgi:hypothetical protein